MTMTEQRRVFSSRKLICKWGPPSRFSFDSRYIIEEPCVRGTSRAQMDGIPSHIIALPSAIPPVRQFRTNKPKQNPRKVEQLEEQIDSEIDRVNNALKCTGHEAVCCRLAIDDMAIEFLMLYSTDKDIGSLSDGGRINLVDRESKLKVLNPRTCPFNGLSSGLFTCVSFTLLLTLRAVWSTNCISPRPRQSRDAKVCHHDSVRFRWSYG